MVRYLFLTVGVVILFILGCERFVTPPPQVVPVHEDYVYKAGVYFLDGQFEVTTQENSWTGALVAGEYLLFNEKDMNGKTFVPFSEGWIRIESGSNMAIYKVVHEGDLQYRIDTVRFASGDFQFGTIWKIRKI